ncbi:MAG: hypothetical protein OXD34_14005 [bacterium]|nr:hypothetical protein [bacterium]
MMADYLPTLPLPRHQAERAEMLMRADDYSRSARRLDAAADVLADRRESLRRAELVHEVAFTAETRRRLRVAEARAAEALADRQAADRAHRGGLR